MQMFSYFDAFRAPPFTFLRLNAESRKFQLAASSSSSPSNRQTETQNGKEYIFFWREKSVCCVGRRRRCTCHSLTRTHTNLLGRLFIHPHRGGLRQEGGRGKMAGKFRLVSGRRVGPKNRAAPAGERGNGKAGGWAIRRSVRTGAHFEADPDREEYVIVFVQYIQYTFNVYSELHRLDFVRETEKKERKKEDESIRDFPLRLFFSLSLSLSFSSTDVEMRTF